MIRQETYEICGICGKPFMDGEVVVQAARYPNPILYRRPTFGAVLRAEILRAEREENKFWAHPACVFTIASPFARQSRSGHLIGTGTPGQESSH
jgi:hypothetical protein